MVKVLEPGDRVRVPRGRLKGFEGIVVHYITGSLGYGGRRPNVLHVRGDDGKVRTIDARRVELVAAADWTRRGCDARSERMLAELGDES